MGYLSRYLAVLGGRRVILAIGVLYISLGIIHDILVHPDGQLGEDIVDFILISGPGLILLYCWYWLDQSGIHSEVYPRIVEWSLGGLGLMLGVVTLLVLNPGGDVDDPIRAALIATALGSVAGIAIGIHDARAQTRAREAEQYSYALEQANAQLETQHQRLESFAGMLAHELRNPLQIAQIYHQQEQHHDEEAAEQVETALSRIEEMIDILLVTVRGTSDSTTVEPVSIADAATEAWNAVTTDVVHGELVLETADTIEADTSHVRYLFRQLMRNSLEAGGDGVTIRVGDLDDRAGFYIEDDGPGIPADVRDDVIEAGFSTKAGGQGLGLTFVAQLAEAYEWEWTITESAAGGVRIEFAGVDRVSADDAGEEVHRN